jgi:hypothetical protein
MDSGSNHVSSMSISSPHTRDLAEKGYCVFKNVIPKEQIKVLRAALADYFSVSGRYQYGGIFALRGMHSLKSVAHLLSSEHILDIVKQCTHPDPAVLTGECDLLTNTTGGWHKDITSEMGLGTSIYGDLAFKIFKVAIYLQDQGKNSRGVLKVRPGSYLHADGKIFPVAPVPVRAGDIVVFDVRIDHAGQLPTFSEKLLHRLLRGAGHYLRKDPEKWYSRARSMINSIRLDHIPRIGVFMTFGPRTQHTFAYEKAGRMRHGSFPADLDAEICKRLAASPSYSPELIAVI